MTLAEFRKRHPRCKVGYPSITFPFLATFACAAFLIMLLRYIIHVVRDYASIEDAQEFFACFGAVCLCMGTGAAVYAGGQRLGEVIDWMRKGRCMYGVAENEAIVVNAEGESAVVPFALVKKLVLDIHNIKMTMDPSYQHASRLDSVLRRVFETGGDGPNARKFYELLVPLVTKLAPHAEIKRIPPPDLFGP